MSPLAIGIVVCSAIVVLGACCLLAPMVVLIPAYDQAKVDTTRSIVDTTTLLVKQYFLRKGTYPDEHAGLRALLDEKLIDKVPRDAWGNDLVYTVDQGRPVITSYGKDGRPGGTGPAADLSSRDTAATTP